MAQSEGNRARFFAQLGKQKQDFNGTAEPSKDLSTAVIPANLKVVKSTDNAMGAVSISKLLPKAVNAHFNPDAISGGIIAQRTRTIETETVFKPNRERHGPSGKLNISGLINKSSDTAGGLKDALSDTARIEELEDISIQPSKPSNSVESSYTCHMPPSNQLTFKVPSSFPLHQTNSPLSRCQTPEKIDHLAEPRCSTNGINFEDASLRGASSVSNKRQAKTKELLLEVDSMPDQDSLQIIIDEDDSPTAPLKEVAAKVYRTSPHPKKISRHNYAGVFDEQNDFNDYRCRLPEFPHLLPSRTHKRPNEDYDVNSRPEKRAKVKKPTNCSTPESSYDDTKKVTSMPDKNQDKLVDAYFGNEINNYIARHVERYEAAKRKWSECSREEWERGATDLTEKVTNIMDFVKDHVRRQVTIYADLHTQIDDYKKSRQVTSDMLENASKSLKKETDLLVESECDN